MHKTIHNAKDQLLNLAIDIIKIANRKIVDD